MDGQIAVLGRLGIPYLELRGVDGKNVAKLSVAEARAVRTKLDDAGIKVWAIASPTGKIDVDDDFSVHLDEFKHMLEIAHIMDASRFRLFSFYGVTDEGKKEKAFAYMEAFLTAAQGSGVVLCHENEKDIYGETAERCLEIHKNLPGLKAVFDPANFIQAGQDVLKAWDMLVPYVEYVHIKDALESGRVVLPGHGEANMSELLLRYKQAGGRVLSVEPHLTEFVGLAALEHGNRQSEIGLYGYKDNVEAFEAAVAALLGLLN